MKTTDVISEYKKLEELAVVRALEFLKAIDVDGVFKIVNTSYHSHSPGRATITSRDNGFTVKYVGETHFSEVHLMGHEIAKSSKEWEESLEATRTHLLESRKKQKELDYEIKRMNRELNDLKEREHKIWKK